MFITEIDYLNDIWNTKIMLLIHVKINCTKILLTMK